MEHRSLGRHGPDVSVLGFGAFKIGRAEGTKYPAAYPLPEEDEAGRILAGVLDLGITLLDTAPAYGLSEERIGRHPWLAGSLSLVGIYSFTLYFLHGYFAGLYRMFSDYLQPPDFAVYLLLRLLLTLVTIAICIGITYCVKRVAKQHSRLLIGS